MEQHRIHFGATLVGTAVSTASGLRGLRTVVFVAALGLCLAADQPAIAQDADIKIGNALADMLRAGRNVVSASQSLINDPNIGDKGLTGEKLVQEAGYLRGACRLSAHW